LILIFLFIPTVFSQYLYLIDARIPLFMLMVIGFQQIFKQKKVKKRNQSIIKAGLINMFIKIRYALSKNQALNIRFATTRSNIIHDIYANSIQLQSIVSNIRSLKFNFIDFVEFSLNVCRLKFFCISLGYF